MGAAGGGGTWGDCRDAYGRPDEVMPRGGGEGVDGVLGRTVGRAATVRLMAGDRANVDQVALAARAEAR